MKRLKAENSRQKEQILQETRTIERQQEEIKRQRGEVGRQQEEIKGQRDEIKGQQEEIKRQQEEIKRQRGVIEREQNKVTSYKKTQDADTLASWHGLKDVRKDRRRDVINLSDTDDWEWDRRCFLGTVDGKNLERDEVLLRFSHEGFRCFRFDADKFGVDCKHPILFSNVPLNPKKQHFWVTSTTQRTHLRQTHAGVLTETQVRHLRANVGARWWSTSDDVSFCRFPGVTVCHGGPRPPSGRNELHNCGRTGFLLNPAEKTLVVVSLHKDGRWIEEHVVKLSASSGNLFHPFIVVYSKLPATVILLSDLKAPRVHRHSGIRAEKLVGALATRASRCDGAACAMP
eukprot:CAMPEP_0170186714 /NCGR_PEP_ID=MMETSP0040_2-20121228/39995_1 /TAXON_ID=641309 /ORGANISM="Lotharella oceanica, Strain CCMP622" /LENGTH=343 /DNA_ID=CAMNT_0010433567 /DNA_START=214 /DNA_END=1245 /DNA_ORIENTATION=+